MTLKRSRNTLKQKSKLSKDLKRSKKRKHKQLAYSILVEEITKNMEKASEPS
jgi:hypothetical protein